MHTAVLSRPKQEDYQRYIDSSVMHGNLTRRAMDTKLADSRPEDRMRKRGSCRRSWGYAAAPNRKSAAASTGHSDSLRTKPHLSVPCRAFSLTCETVASPLMPCAGAEMNGYERESPFSIAEVGNAAPASEQQAVEDCSQQQSGGSHQNGSSSAEGEELQQGNGNAAARSSTQGMHTPRVGETLDSMDASDLWLDAGAQIPF